MIKYIFQLFVGLSQKDEINIPVDTIANAFKKLFIFIVLIYHTVNHLRR
jgi:hypothetical protein